MKILFVLPRIPWPLHDGGAVATYQQMRYLRRAGHHITVLALNPVKFRQDPSVLEGVADRIITVDIDTTPKPLAALRYFFSNPPYKYRRFFSEEMASKLEEILWEAFEAGDLLDAVVLDQTPMVLYAETAVLMCNIPVVHRNHNVEYTLLERLALNSSSPLMSWYLQRNLRNTRRMERECYSNLDGIIPMTEPDAERIRALGVNVPMRPIPLGVDLEAFKQPENVNPRPNSLFYLGSFDWTPNSGAVHWLMREIWPALKSKFPDLELHIGGKNPDESILAFNNLPDVHVHPNVPSAPDFLHAYDIMLAPLRIGGGMRVKVVEAMAASKAIISTTIGAEGINYTDGQDILIADTPARFVEAIDRLRGDAEYKRSIEAAARRTAVAKYSWEVIMRDFADFLQESIDNYGKN